MASSTQSSFEGQFLCSICLDFFTEPVSTPCGHNFCKDCISQIWNSSVQCKCPQCDRSFSTKPELSINTLFDKMVSQLKLEFPSKQVSKPVEVQCDICSEPKLKAEKSCLVCLSSFCESHLQPHLRVSGLKKHQLMEPVDNLEDRTCPIHKQPLELFCHTEQKTLCTMCSVQEHENHRLVTLKEVFEQEKLSLQLTVAENQRLMAHRRLKVQEIQRLLDMSETESQSEAATGLQAITAIMHFVQTHYDSFLEQSQEQQRNNQRQAKALLLHLQQEISVLDQSSTEAQQLLLSTDPLLRLQHRPTLPPKGLRDWRTVSFEPQKCEGSAARALSVLEKKLSKEFSKVLRPELRRVQQFAVDVTLDADTAFPSLALSKDLKQVHHTDTRKKLRDGPQRFDTCPNVLAKQSFSSGRFYFEVQVKGKTHWELGVALESVMKKGQIRLCPVEGFWTISLRNRSEYRALSAAIIILSPQRPPEKIGVFVDYGEGLVSFYDVHSARLLYSFTHCSFRGRLFPFFCPGFNCKDTNTAPLIICAVKTTSEGDKPQ